MYDHNQRYVSDAFIALYTVRGRLTIGRAEIEARYEACDDLSNQVAKFCQTLQFDRDLSEDEALRRCHQGLLATPETVSEAEAGWVICRVAELLSWPVPEWLAPKTGA